MDSISIPAAIAQAHKKDKEVRAACLPFDTAVLSVRRKYMLAMDHSQWAANVAARLELANKDHRAGLRMSLHNLHGKLCKLYGGAEHPEADDDNVGALAVTVMTSASDAGRTRQTDQGAKAGDSIDLTGDMNAKHAGALDLCHRLEGLMEKVKAVNDMYGKNPATSVKDRVRLRRSMPQFTRKFKEASEKKETILRVAAEWMPYFVTLSSKNALDQLIEIDHSMKIPKKVFLSRAKPHCQRLARLFDAREELISASGRLAFRLETAWTALPSLTLPTHRVNYELQEFDDFLARAQALFIEHGEVEKALEELSRFAASLTVVTGLDGGEVDFARLKQAYTEYRQFMSLLDGTIKLCAPLQEEILATISAFPHIVTN